uniref:Queuine tRNA-ribosyltransferase accessory subunit 2 n=1 Tax=Panagrellus redivivus TaxID=6233 RepID=A0A7E4VUA0_PANRE
MVKAKLLRNTERGRTCNIESWGAEKEPKSPLNLQTPAYLTYTRFGHIPHLTWDVAQKELSHLEQKPIYQVSMAAIFECLLAIDEAGGIIKFASMPENCLTHLTIHDPLGRIASGFNKTKGIAVWSARAGRKDVCSEAYPVSIAAVKSDTITALSDYDLPFDAQKKRQGKSLTRTKAWNEALFSEESKTGGRPAFAPICGGSNKDTRFAFAKAFVQVPWASGFSIELWHFSLGPKVDKKQVYEKDVIAELLGETMLLLPQDKVRLVEGAFNPTQILHLIKLGVDLFDSSFASLMADEGKAFKIADDFESTWEFSVLDFNDAKFNDDTSKLYDHCSCYPCQTFTKAYLRHLVNCKEMLAMVLLTIHNMTEFDRMFARIRESLQLAQ